MDRSPNIYERNQYQPKREMGPWIQNITVMMNNRIHHLWQQNCNKVGSFIAAKLGLHGEIRESQVNVINGTVATFETTPMEFTLRRMNGQFNTVIEAFTINDVTGDLKTVN